MQQQIERLDGTSEGSVDAARELRRAVQTGRKDVDAGLLRLRALAVRLAVATAPDDAAQAADRLRHNT